MYSRWYYTHEGTTHGPFSPVEVRQRLVSGLLPPQVLLWPEVADLQVIVEALTAVELAAAAGTSTGEPTPSSVPTPPAPAPAASGAVPAWLAGLQPSEKAAAPPAEPSSPAKPKLPDWLDDIRGSA